MQRPAAPLGQGAAAAATTTMTAPPRDSQTIAQALAAAAASGPGAGTLLTGTGTGTGAGTARSRIRSTSSSAQGGAVAGRHLGVQNGPSSTSSSSSAAVQAAPPIAAAPATSDASAGGGAAGFVHPKGVPAFLVKLYSMINDPATDALIYWARNGRSFFIPDHQQFGQTLLPQFFKHANFTSFVRQLNMYGFKKVPHLQAAALSSFAPAGGSGSTRSGAGTASAGITSPNPAAPQHPELWEFTNPKFMRGRPELLGSIVRKKSAKELAAAQAAHHDEERGGGRRGDEDADVDMDERGRGDAGAVAGVRSGARPLPSTAPATVSAAPSSSTSSSAAAPLDASVSQALALMHTTHTSLEKEMAALKSSNEMLWRQWMMSREAQLKSEKKVDSIMRFLAGQFGGMNMGMAIDGGASGAAGAVGAGAGAVGGLGMDASGEPGRLRRLGSQRMIGDGVVGAGDGPGSSASPSDVMSIDGLSPDKADDDDIWEFDASGQLVKMKAAAKGKTPSRSGIMRNTTSTPARRTFANMPHTSQPNLPSTHASNSPDRFIDLDGSPEEKALGGFESREGSPPMINGAFASGSTGHLSLPSKGALFPPSSSTTTTPEGASLRPSPSNALTTYQPSTGVTSSLASQLDPAILNLPLGALLGSAAGAQLLANLSQIAAFGLGHQQSQAHLQGNESDQLPPLRPHVNGADTSLARVDAASANHTNGIRDVFDAAAPDQPSWLSASADHSFEALDPAVAPLPLDNILDPNNMLASALSPAAQVSGDPTLSNNPPPSAGFDMSAGFHLDTPNGGIPGVNDDVTVNWDDPEMARLLESFERSGAGGNANSHNMHVTFPGGGLGNDDFGYANPDDKMLDFEKYFDESLGAGGDGAGADGEKDKLQEPTRKKRKTDERG